ncbi:Fic family protein [Corynebacterium meridianum]|uniref:Fic family protein n=1 Tax=Corynebacterium meridianum TaxID=2765363 RepID=A0A934HZV3_9CORY|nr:Fic family protein [Corynebacterium meridianum]MBI8988690.1 Fic family protein [Corynebacterium meridianum]
MDREQYRASKFGEVRTCRIGPPFDYYLPKKIPRKLPESAELMAILSEADAALGRLDGLGSIVKDVSLLIRPYQQAEAVASTRIEGTRATISDVLKSELSQSQNSDDTREVQRYLSASKLAYTLLESLPISQRLICQVHADLMCDVRGAERNPGELRRSPVWIGGVSATLNTARFVPPVADELPALLTDWERYVNEERNDIPVLIRAALMHYQFETIHPFLDGNGRMGRLLINLFLKSSGRLNEPLLYLSGYFERNRDRYYETLQAVREEGDVVPWLRFFLEAVRDQSIDAVERAQGLVEVRERFREQARGSGKPNLYGLADILIGMPIVTVKKVQNELGISNQGARNVLNLASSPEYAWITSRGKFGRGAAEYWEATEVLGILERDVER